MFLKGQSQRRQTLNPELREHEISRRIFEDNLTGDPFKQAFEARKNPVNGSQIFNKGRQQYFECSNILD